jgi:hypothetical protein
VRGLREGEICSSFWTGRGRGCEVGMKVVMGWMDGHLSFFWCSGFCAAVLVDYVVD